MRTLAPPHLAAFLAAALLFSAPAFAQQTNSSPETLPANPPPDSNPAVNPSSLIPEPPTPMVPTPLTQPRRNGARPAASPAGTPKLSKTEVNVEQMKMGTRLYEVKTLALRDPAIQDQIAWAEAAKTDEGKRERLVAYYKMLYARIVKIDGTLKPLAASLLADQIAGTVQSNIQKSTLIEPK